MARKIYKTDDGKFAVAYDHQQAKVFSSVNKIVCHIYEDQQLTKKLHYRPELKHINRLTLIE